jgi:hypothetical protein
MPAPDIPSFRMRAPAQPRVEVLQDLLGRTGMSYDEQTDTTTWIVMPVRNGD